MRKLRVNTTRRFALFCRLTLGHERGHCSSHRTMCSHVDFSMTITRCPASESTAAATPPPAPEPEITTSHSTVMQFDAVSSCGWGSIISQTATETCCLTDRMRVCTYYLDYCETQSRQGGTYLVSARSSKVAHIAEAAGDCLLRLLCRPQQWLPLLPEHGPGTCMTTTTTAS